MIRAFESPQPPPLTLAMLLWCLARALSLQARCQGGSPHLPPAQRESCIRSRCQQLSLFPFPSPPRVGAKRPHACQAHLRFPLSALGGGGSSATDFSESFGRGFEEGREGGWRQRRGPAFPASSARSSHPAPLADWNVLASQSSHAAKLRGGAAAPSLDLRCGARLRGRANVLPRWALQSKRQGNPIYLSGMLGQ